MPKSQQESGHYSIAGFLFQLIGTGVKKFKIIENDNAAESVPKELVIVEFAGQDAVLIPADKSGKKPVLTQYKFTSKTAEIKPSELRKILDAFRKSAGAIDCRVEQLQYELITNRGLSPGAEKWLNAKADKTKLKKLIKKSKIKGNVASINQLVTVFQNMEYKREFLVDYEAKINHIGADYGMYPDEIKQGSQAVLGYLLQTASSEYRILEAKKLLLAFTSCANPLKLLSTDSIELRRESAKGFKRHETSNQENTIPRAVSSKIAEAVLHHPFIVVVGDGGCGKSVAAADALVECLSVRNQPPGFGLLLPAKDAVPETVMTMIANWQGRTTHSDGANKEKSIKRLKVAFADTPVAVFFVDAIDETHSDGELDASVKKFLYDTISNSVEQQKQTGRFDLCVVITCRRIAEIQNLGRGLDLPFNPEPFEVDVFDSDEVGKAARVFGVNREIEQRILGHIKLRTPNADASVGRQPNNARPVDPLAFGTIRHPLFWRFFCQLDKSDQELLLDGDRTQLGVIADKYLTWAHRKCNIRIGNISLDEFRTVLREVANQFGEEPAKVVDKSELWDVPCKTAGCTLIRGNELFTECLTAGIIKEETANGSRWRWNYPWFCDVLSNNGVQS